MKMKRKFVKRFSVILGTIMVLLISSIPIYASNEKDATDGYVLKEDSTWGDLYQYFDPDGFAVLDTQLQELYNALPLEIQDNATTFSIEDDGDSLLSSTESVVYTTGYLYDSTSTDRAVDIKGLVYFVMGTESSRNSIGYSTALSAPVSCPMLQTSISLYEKSSGRFIDFNSDSDLDSRLLNINDTFDGLDSGTEYTIISIATVLPPSGYVCSGIPQLQQNVETKK